VVSHSQQTYVSQTDMEAIFPKGADAILQLTLSSISEASVTSADKNARTADRENNAKYGVIEAKGYAAWPASCTPWRSNMKIPGRKRRST